MSDKPTRTFALGVHPTNPPILGDICELRDGKYVRSVVIFKNTGGKATMEEAQAMLEGLRALYRDR